MLSPSQTTSAPLLELVPDAASGLLRHHDPGTQLDYYLNHPDRLYSPEPLAHARTLLDAAVSAGEIGPFFQKKRDQLNKLIETASKPSSVLLKSDEKTDVSVYRVGQFGMFRERRLVLRPGIYTAVGSRPGYRDVRIQFRVPMPKGKTVVVIRCEERI